MVWTFSWAGFDRKINIKNGGWLKYEPSKTTTWISTVCNFHMGYTHSITHCTTWTSLCSARRMIVIVAHFGRSHCNASTLLHVNKFTEKILELLSRASLKWVVSSVCVWSTNPSHIWDYCDNCPLPQHVFLVPRDEIDRCVYSQLCLQGLFQKPHG
jgi:hypothetical protein